MKNFALVTAFALLAAVPASAAEIFKAAPAMTPVRQSQQVIPRFVENFESVPRCYTLHGYSCGPSGATQACTDACNYDLSCTCRDFYYNMSYIGSYWICDYEC
jgi:hypothetical protein